MLPTKIGDGASIRGNICAQELALPHTVLATVVVVNDRTDLSLLTWLSALSVAVVQDVNALKLYLRCQLLCRIARAFCSPVDEIVRDASYSLLFTD